MNKFPDGCNEASNYEFNYSSHGIGCSLDMKIPISIKGQRGDFTIEIFGPDEW